MATEVTLDQVNTAITAILTTGQSVRLLDRSYTRADLEQLLKLRTVLQGEGRRDSIFQPVRFVPR